MKDHRVVIVGDDKERTFETTKENAEWLYHLSLVNERISSVAVYRISDINPRGIKRILFNILLRVYPTD
jgi:hypothetical protein